MFINFDGPDGSGKSGLIDKVYNKLSNDEDLNEYNIIKTIEPGHTDLGKEIRDYLLDNRSDIDNMTEFLLYITDRSDHYNKFLKPKLNNKRNIILSDRYFESSYIYQHVIRETINFFQFQMLHKMATKNLKPDITFIVYSKSNHSLSRDRMDEEMKQHRQQMIQHYITLKNDKYFNYEIQNINTEEGKWEDYSDNMVGYIKQNIKNL